MNEVLTYEALRAERDVLADKCERLEYNLGNALIGEQETIRRADALAVENAALKGVVGEINEELYGKGLEVSGWHLNGDLEPLDNWFTDNGWGIPETPATDAALSAIEARGVEKFADRLNKTAIAICSVNPDKTTSGAYAGLARSFAKKLREAK